MHKISYLPAFGFFLAMVLWNTGCQKETYQTVCIRENSFWYDYVWAGTTQKLAIATYNGINDGRFEVIHFNDGLPSRTVAVEFDSAFASFLPEWSPDGNKLIYVKRTNAYGHKYDTIGINVYDCTLNLSRTIWKAGPVLVVDPQDQQLDTTIERPEQLCISPDGSKLAVQTTKELLEIDCSYSVEANIIILDFISGSVIKKITLPKNLRYCNLIRWDNASQKLWIWRNTYNYSSDWTIGLMDPKTGVITDKYYGEQNNTFSDLAEDERHILYAINDSRLCVADIVNKSIKYRSASLISARYPFGAHHYDSWLAGCFSHKQESIAYDTEDRSFSGWLEKIWYKRPRVFWNKGEFPTIKMNIGKCYYYPRRSINISRIDGSTKPVFIGYGSRTYGHSQIAWSAGDSLLCYVNEQLMGSDVSHHRLMVVKIK